MKIGEIFYKKGEIEINKGKEAKYITVVNMGDRPVQVGSHYHFFECNFALRFDREAAFGRHLDIPAGMAVRFGPGEETRVGLVEYDGDRKIMGFNEMTMGYADDETTKKDAIIRVRKRESEELQHVNEDQA